MSEAFKKQLREHSQEVKNIVGTPTSESSGWATTGTTTLTGATVIDTDGNGLEFNGDVVIKNRVSDDEALFINSTLNSEVSYLRAKNATGDGNSGVLHASTTDTLATASISADFNDTVKYAGIGMTANATEGKIIIIANDGIDASDAIQPYADNAAALAAIGAGKLYYTDDAGEYIVKMSH